MGNTNQPFQIPQDNNHLTVPQKCFGNGYHKGMQVGKQQGMQTGLLMAGVPLLVETTAVVGYAIKKAVDNNPKTMGGKVFWTNLREVNGWKLQKNVFTGHCRILDKNNVRQDSGNEQDMLKKFNSMRKI